MNGRDIVIAPPPAAPAAGGRRLPWSPRKSIGSLTADAERAGLERAGLERALGATDLTLLGVGAMVGAGILVLTGQVAAAYAGPAVVLSFVLAGVACAFAGLCYAEFASLIPVAGSAYTYAYAALGELFAWIIGWDLILEYARSASTVAVGWSGYAANLLELPCRRRPAVAPGGGSSAGGRWIPASARGRGGDICGKGDGARVALRANGRGRAGASAERGTGALNVPLDHGAIPSCEVRPLEAVKSHTTA